MSIADAAEQAVAAPAACAGRLAVGLCRDAALRPHLLAAVIRSRRPFGRLPLNGRSLIWNDPATSSRRSSGGCRRSSFPFLIVDDPGDDEPGELCRRLIRLIFEG
jgi:hypothetical protein